MTSEEAFIKLKMEGLRQTNKNGVEYRWVFDGWQKNYRLEIIEDGHWSEAGHYKTVKSLYKAILGLK